MHPLPRLSLTLALAPSLTLALGLTLTLTVRPGIRFHDDGCFEGGTGREVGPQDVRYMLMRHADPGVQSIYYGAFVAGRIKGLDQWREQAESDGFADYEAEVEGLTVKGRSLTIRLSSPYPQLYSLLTQPWASIVPREAVQRYGSGFGERPVGSGPFLFKERDALGTIVMVRNPRYRIPGKPLIDELRFEHVPDIKVRTKRFMSGDLQVVDLWSHNSPEFLDRFGRIRPALRRKGMRVAPGTELEISYFIFNCKNALLGKKQVRQAMCLALDREAFVKAAAGPGQRLANLPFPNTFPESAMFDQAAAYRFATPNLEEARKLLAAAGHPGGKGLPEFIFDFPGSLGPKELAAYAIFEKSMAAIGLKFQRRDGTFDRFMERARSGDLQLAWVRWYADYPDVENFLLLLRSNENPVGNFNYGSYKSGEYDRLYDRMARLYPGAERNELVKQMVRIVQEDCPWLMLYYSRSDRVVGRGVSGYRHNVTNLSMRDVGLRSPR